MLAIQNLHFQYRSATSETLRGVSFNAARGQVLGLLGPNGAGKTTLIAHLAGLIPAQANTITLAGIALSEVRKTQPTRIGYAPQDFAFYPTLTVRENLKCFAAAARLHGAQRNERIHAGIAIAQLEAHADVRAERLSGGLKRRLNLAIAVLAEPEVLLLDEPTAGVDPQSRAFLLDTVRALANAGTTIIYTSHYMEEIEAIADRVVILDHGHVLRDDTLNNLLTATGRQLHFVLNQEMPATVKTSIAAFGTLEQHGDAWQLTLHDKVMPAAALAQLEHAGIALRSARYGYGDLETLFMSLTQRSLRD